MMDFRPHPLARAWVILMALAILTLVLGLYDPHTPLGLAGAFALMATTVIKGRQILLDYLELRHAGGGWRAGLTVYLSLVALLILAAYAATYYGWPVKR
jgi:hypothetical protein